MISLEPIPGPPSPRFSLGDIVITQGAVTRIERKVILASLRRHVIGDWGELDEEDKRANDLALESGGRLLSVFSIQKQERFYIITEADRSVTTILLPEEY